MSFITNSIVFEIALEKFSTLLCKWSQFFQEEIRSYLFKAYLSPTQIWARALKLEVAKLLSEWRSQLWERSAQWVVVTVASGLLGLLLPVWKHCLTSWHKGDWPLSTLSGACPRWPPSQSQRLSRRKEQSPAGCTHTAHSLRIDRWGHNEKCWHTASPGKIASQVGTWGRWSPVFLIASTWGPFCLTGLEWEVRGPWFR